MSDKKEVNVIIKALDETLPGFKSARHSVADFASEAKGLIAEAFAAFTVFEFFKTAIEKATESEQAYVQLSNTLANVGVNYEHNREQIEATIKSLQKVANVRTDEAIKGFNTLVQRSGDYNGSLKNMVLVADLAKAKHLEFNEAAELVGRVMGGNTRVLKQFGIVTKDATDGIQQLREKLHGAAEADLNTFAGRVEYLKNRFFDFAEQVGDVITGNTSLQGSIKSVGEWLESLTKSVEKNGTQYTYWFTVIFAGVRESARAFMDLITIAYQTGNLIGHVLSLSWGNPGDKEKRAALYKEIEENNKTGTKAINDLSQGFDRFGDALALAQQKEADGVHRTQAELDKAGGQNAQRLAERAAAEQAARDKKAKAEEDARNREIDQQVAHLGKAADLREFKDRAIRETAIAGLNLMDSLARRELAGMAQTNDTLSRRLVLEDRLKTIAEAKKKAGLADPREHFNQSLEAAQPRNTEGSILSDIAPTLAKAKIDAKEMLDLSKRLRKELSEHPLPGGGVFGGMAAELTKHANALMGAGTAWGDLGTAIGAVATGPLLQFGEGMAMAMGALITGSKTAGQAFKQAMLSALGSVAKAEGDFFVGKAIAATGDALLGNPLAIFAHANYLAAAAALYAVAGAASAAGSSGGGGGASGAGGFVGGNGNSLANSASQGPVTIVLNGSKMLIDSENPGTQDEFIAMIQRITGNRQVNFVIGGG